MKAILEFFGLMTIKSHLHTNELLREAFKKESDFLQEFAADILLNPSNKQPYPEGPYITYVVEHYDPSRYIYDSFTLNFSNIQEARDVYERIKATSGTHQQESLTLYKKEILRHVEVEYVQKKK